jgi:hypothetical protein
MKMLCVVILFPFLNLIAEFLLIPLHHPNVEILLGGGGQHVKL